MPIISFSATLPPIIIEPPPIVPPREAATGFRSIWTGWDGSSWDLNDDSTGVCLQEGVRGLAMPPVTQYRAESPGVAGARYKGTRITAREVFWPLQIYTTPGSAYADLDSAFWRTLDPTKLGTWTVYQPSGEARALDLRYETDDPTWDFDPALRGYNLYGVSMIADQPYWRGNPITRVFSNVAPVSFFGPPGVFRISSSASIGTATIDNPGDVPAWITWTLTGPIDAATVGMSGGLISIVDPIAAGSSLTIWTSPDQMIAVDGSGYEHPLDPAAKFKSVAAGGTTTLSLTMSALTAAASIQASLTPYYYRAL